MDINNLENIVANKNLLPKINGQSRNSQLYKLIILSIETNKQASEIGNKITAVNIKGNPLEAEINDWAKLLSILINTNKKALIEANVKLDPKPKDPLDTEMDDEFAQQIKQIEIESQKLKEEKLRFAEDQDNVNQERAKIIRDQQQLVADRLTLDEQKDELESSLNKLNREKNEFNLLKVQYNAHTIKIEDSDEEAQKRHRIYKLDSNIKAFDGRGDVENFIFVADTALHNNNIPRNKQLGLLTPYFSGTALEYLRRFSKNGNNSWEEFKKILRDQYTPIDRKEMLMDDLMNFKQYGQNFDGFVRQYMSLINRQTAILTEEQKLYHFVRALRNETRYEVKRSDPKTLEDAIKAATTFERLKAPAKREEIIEINYMKNADKFSNNDQKPAKNKNGTKGFNNNRGKGTKSHEDYNKQCFHCKEFGHRYKECPNRRSINNILTENTSKQKDENSADDDNSPENRANTSNYTTANTTQNNSPRYGLNTVSTIRFEREDEGTAAHTNSSRGLRMNSLLVTNTTIKTSKLPACLADINGKSVMALIDTGAEVCAISKTLAIELGLSFGEHMPTVVTAINTVSEQWGIAKNLRINVFGYQCYMDFVIIDSLSDITLGTPWLEMMSAQIHFNIDGTRKLIIGQERIDDTIENDIPELISESSERNNASSPSEQDSTVSEKFHWDEKCELAYETLKSKIASHYGKLEFELIEFTKDTSMAGQNIKSNSRSEPTMDLLEAFWIKFVLFGGRINSDHMEIFEKVSNKNAGLLQYYWTEDEFVLKQIVADVRIQPEIRDREYLIKQEHAREHTSPLITLKRLKQRCEPWRHMPEQVMNTCFTCQLCKEKRGQLEHWRDNSINESQ